VERLELALARFRGTATQLRDQVSGLLDDAERHRPTPPPGGAA
jgi:hypothetical protein